MYKDALMNSRKYLDKGLPEEMPSRSLVAPRQQGLQEKQYDPMDFLKKGMMRIREASRAIPEEFEIPKPKPMSFTDPAGDVPEFSREEYPDMVESVSEDGVPVTENAAHYGLVKRPTPKDGGGFLGLIDAHEGGGDYSALLGFSNRDEFKGVDVTKMTLAEIDAFAKSEYASWSKEWKKKRGHGDASVPSTPMGRYQFVNTTLQAQARKMGLDPKTTRFTPEVQDRMFQSYLQDRLSRADTPQGKLKQLRAAWEGFKRVPDERLLAAIDSMESA